MSSSNRTGRVLSSLPEPRTLLLLAALCALGGCSMWQQWHSPKPAVAEAPAVPESQAAPPADPPTTGSTDNAPASQPAAGNDAAPGPGTAAIEPRKDAPAIRTVRRAEVSSSSRDALSMNDVGYYMDVLQGQLTQAVGREARIERRGSSIVLLLPLGFDVDSTQLNFAGRRTMRRLAEILSEYRLTIVAVQVSGPDAEAQGANPRLASDRVAVLSKYLAHAGVAGKRISVAAEGSSLLQADSGPASLRGVRAELQVSPIVVGASN
jgi:outer membrane protein OmpA-like peptidoglycan-associated protein